MTVLQAISFVLVALGALAVVATRDPLRQILVNGIFGWSLAALFMVLQAPDVALSMIVISSVAYPLVVLLAIRRTRREK